MFSAAALLADTTTRTTVALGRISSNADWLLPGAIFAALAMFIVVLYLFDCRRLSATAAVVLISLRLAAALGLLLLYAEPQWRSERQITKNSRVLLLADTSRSMGRSDAAGASGTGTTRSDLLIAELAGGKLLDELRKTHDIVVARFDRDTSQIVMLEKFDTSDSAAPPVTDAASSQSPQMRQNLRNAAACGLALALLCVLTYPLIWLLAGRNLTPWPSALLAATGLLVGAAAIAWLDLGNPHTKISRLLDVSEPVVGWLDWDEQELEEEDEGVAKPQAVDGSLATTPAESVDWSSALAPQGDETRLGDALRRWIYDFRNAPLSGIIVITDGGLNAGVDGQAAIALAKAERIKIFCIGMGSLDRPVNVALSNMSAPARAYPGDSFEITGIVQGYGLKGRSITVELTSRDVRAGAAQGGGRSEGVQQITLGDDGQEVSIKFEVENVSDDSASGDSVSGDGGPTTSRRLYTLKIDAPKKDTNPRDNQRQQLVEIVDRTNRVLLLAGGPTREFRFLRNMLHRDKRTTVDVFLQTAREGIVQDANLVLDEFPISPTELGEYDALVAFDFDWRVLDQGQIDFLEAWVAEQAGGLIVVAGPVYTSAWANDPNERRKLTKIRDLYPVRFRSSVSNFVAADDDRFSRTEPHPIEFTREGLQSPFLWLGETAAISEKLWASFEGVYGYLSVEGVKPGATVYGYFDDPEAAAELGQPVYLAEHFFGAGRVFYLGSGEMWRIRALDEAFFDKFYTKLIRHVSQGRLLRGSRHGLLLVSQDRVSVGGSVEVRAHLKNARGKPLVLERVELQLIDPGGSPQTLTLSPEGGRPGLYQTQFTARKEGLYRLELELPIGQNEILATSVQATVGDLERDHSLRNDKLLREIADGTKGKYLVGLESVAGEKKRQSFAAQFFDRTETDHEPGVLDRLWEEKWMRWAMVFVVSMLSLEWLIRRLLKLA